MTVEERGSAGWRGQADQRSGARWDWAAECGGFGAIKLAEWESK
jgi:hypothetical protein